MGNRAIVIEEHHEHGVDWVVSFDGPAPAPEKCFVAASKDDAFKAAALINGEAYD